MISSYLCGLRCPECGVSAPAVVEALDPVEEREPGLVAGAEGVPVEQFGLDGGEEALGDGVVEGVAAAAHARQDAGVLHRLAEGEARVLGPPVWRVAQAGCWPAPAPP